MTTITVRGAPTLGGHVRTELGGVTGVGLIGFGFAGPTAFCTCTVGHEWAAMSVGTAHSLAIPMALLLVGLDLRIQGADLGGAGGCSFPPVTFTETWLLRLQ